MRTWFCRASPTLKKFGTMINVTGRIQRLNRAIQPIGYARDDWQIFRDITLLLGGNPALKDFNSALDILTAMSTEYGALNGVSWVPSESGASPFWKPESPFPWWNAKKTRAANHTSHAYNLLIRHD